MVHTTPPMAASAEIDLSSSAAKNSVGLDLALGEVDDLLDERLDFLLGAADRLVVGTLRLAA